MSILVLRGKGGIKGIVKDGGLVYTGNKHDTEDSLQTAVEAHSGGGEVIERQGEWDSLEALSAEVVKTVKDVAPKRQGGGKEDGSDEV